MEWSKLFINFLHRVLGMLGDKKKTLYWTMPHTCSTLKLWKQNQARIKSLPVWLRWLCKERDIQKESKKERGEREGERERERERDETPTKRRNSGYTYRWLDWRDGTDRRHPLQTRKFCRESSGRTRRSLPAVASTCCWCLPVNEDGKSRQMLQDWIVEAETFNFAK